MTRTIEAMSLDLGGANVITEAATGAYAVTPVLAAMAGAESIAAITRPSRFGSVEDVTEQTFALAELAGVADRIAIHDVLTAELVGAADIVTNSGHVRPIDRTVIGWMQDSCVVPLMFEAWEIDAGRLDVDLDALRERGIRFAGTNERHPAVGVFEFLGSMALKLFIDAQFALHGSRVLLVCNNPFMPYLSDGLTRAGAVVIPNSQFSVLDLDPQLDAVLVALTPHDREVLDAGDLRALVGIAPGALLIQFWGDVSREECAQLGVQCVPLGAPGRGHMGVLPSAIGPEPIVRLQAGGLKVASILRRPKETWTTAEREYIDEC